MYYDRTGILKFLNFSLSLFLRARQPVGWAFFTDSTAVFFLVLIFLGREFAIC